MTKFCTLYFVWCMVERSPWLVLDGTEGDECIEPSSPAFLAQQANTQSASHQAGTARPPMLEDPVFPAFSLSHVRPAPILDKSRWTTFLHSHRRSAAGSNLGPFNMTDICSRGAYRVERSGPLRVECTVPGSPAAWAQLSLHVDVWVARAMRISSEASING